MKKVKATVMVIFLLIIGLMLVSCQKEKAMENEDGDLFENQESVGDDDQDKELSDAPKVFSGLDFEDSIIPNYITSADATMELIDNSTGSKALKVMYSVADFPTVRFTAMTPWDFGEQNALSFEVTNPSDKVITFYLRMDDDIEADGQSHSTVSTIVIQPNSTEHYFFSMGGESVDFGMKNLPVTDAGKQLSHSWGETSLNSGTITEFQLWQMYVTEASTLIFDDIEIIRDPNANLSVMDHMIDAYGQYTGLDWDGKVTSDEDLLADKEAERLTLGTSDKLVTSRYGGWAEGPKLKATGYFRVEKYENKWTMVDPDGYLFFATGLDIARLDDGNTWVSGRENMFELLPTQEGDLGDHYSYTTHTARAPLGQTEGWLFNHYSANLERKYGEDYTYAWRDISVERFKDWGFSSIGNWSNPELFFGKGKETQIAYVANGWSNGNHALIPSGNEFWGPVADPFDPEFVKSVDRMIDEQILAYGVADDPWCMGVYIDNETAWGNPSDTQGKYALITSIFAMDASKATSYAKKAMIEYLKSTYSEDIEALNTVWGTKLASFEVLEGVFTPELITEAMVPDYSAMLKKLGVQYFGVVDAALESKMPNTLYLGSRFAEWGTSEELQEAAAQFVDVVSFNVYKENVVGEDWMKLEALDMPVIIGEFHFGSTDRGMFGGGLVNAIDQKDRGEKYKQYINTVAQSPYFIGAHWFQYYDQPLLGRAWDGENYNVGFVDVTDQPYGDLVQAAREINSKVYDVRYNNYDINEAAAASMKQEMISFESSEDDSLLNAYKETLIETVTNGVTEGSNALQVTVGKLDADYSGLEFKPAMPWDMGVLPTISADITNPGTKDIQLRINVADIQAQIRTFYFPISAGETRTITMTNFGPSADVWDPDGFWGANDGLKVDEIAMLDFYLWEEADFESGNTFIIDNLSIAVK